MEEGLDKAKSAFSQLDAQMSQSTQTATKIGDRLHVCPFCSPPYILPGML